ncbi:transposase [Candidatus Bathyarchaeota archaeon A05DMB-2]|jgi:IS5 family transposase|nr:transposase [Candidatus Bathyarchaeota archaeon A05DMB-2]
MEEPRFVETGSGSFYGDYLYEQVVPPQHFLRQLKQMIEWKRFTRKLLKLYKGGGVVGRPPFDPALVLKVELIAYLYNLTERQVEVYVNENLPAKYFVGLAVDEKAPDHSTLTVFRERLIQRGKLKVFEELLEEIVQLALQKGIEFGSIQIVDSVHSIANVNPEKDQKRQDQGGEPRDPDARWGVKHTRKVKNEAGQEEEQVQYFYGYKAHVSLNAANHLITSLECSSGEAYDGYHFTSLVDHDLAQQLPVETYTADKAYDDGENHYNLEVRGLHSAIRLKKTRTEKKDDNKQVWLELRQTPQYQQGLKERYKVERKFGEAKQGHGFGRCRYLGRWGFIVQSFFMAIMLNLKRMVRLVAGVGFKTRVVA